MASIETYTKTHDFVSLLSSFERDFLVRNNGDQVKIDNLKGKKLGLYYSAHWCAPCNRLTPKLVEVYNGLSPKNDFEIVFVIAYVNEKSFEVPISELEGKTVDLYFSSNSDKPCSDFTSKLVEVYYALKAEGESFEVVIVSMDDDGYTFYGALAGMPWLALPYKDSCQVQLIRDFEISTPPTVVIIWPDGTTLHTNVAEAIEEHGTEAYPCTPEKLAELSKMEKAREHTQGKEGTDDDENGESIKKWMDLQWGGML